jgi:TRAP-type C4-dicarboxylate transport system permease small subunit
MHWRCGGMMKRLLGILDKIADYMVGFLMLMLMVIGGAQVFSRYILNYSLTWSEELSRYILVWLVFMAIGVGLRRRAHIGMNVIVTRFSKGIQRWFDLFSCVVAIAFGVAVIFYTYQLIQTTMFQTTAALGIPIRAAYYGMVFGGLYTVIIGLRFFAAKLFAPKQVKDGEN